jgi:hypothetical protein
MSGPEQPEYQPTQLPDDYDEYGTEPEQEEGESDQSGNLKPSQPLTDPA